MELNILKAGVGVKMVLLGMSKRLREIMSNND